MCASGPRATPLSVDDIAHRYDLPLGHVISIFNRAHTAMTPMGQTIEVMENDERIQLRVTRLGVGILQTPHGEYWLYDMYVDDKWQKYSVLVKCSSLDDRLMPVFKNKEELIMRTDSGCETGQIFHDATCECREQLHLAMDEVSSVGEGMIISIPRQDGRGKGLSFKLATLILQYELGVNTVEAAAMLAAEGDIDIRTYAGVVAILRFFDVQITTRINLATNNPYKSHVLLDNGYQLGNFHKLIIPPTDFTRRHLRAKHDMLGHRGIGEEQ